MSGHSHWSTIKYKKAATDAKRGKLFSKLSKAVSVAARQGGDPAFNAKLRAAVEVARSSGLPKDNIEKAIKKGSGTAEGTALIEVNYEAYAHGGVALLVECITDKPVRTLPEVRRIIESHNGKMGAAGSVAWLFRRKSLISVEKSAVDEDTLMGIVMDAGAEDISDIGEFWEIISRAEAHAKILKALEAANITPKVSELRLIADNELTLDNATQAKVLRLMQALEDHDDVQNVYANFIPSAEAVAALGE